MGDCTTGEQRARRTAVFNFGASRSDLGDVQMNAEKTGCVSASGAESNTAYRLSCLYDGGRRLGDRLDRVWRRRSADRTFGGRVENCAEP